MKSFDKVKNRIPKVPEDEISKPESNGDLALELEKAIDEYIKGTIKGRFKKSEGFSPSNTNECARYLVYLFRGAWLPAEHDARVQRIFDTGNDTHERIYGYLSGMGILRGKEIPIRLTIVNAEQRDVPFKVVADCILDWGGESIGELKSISENGFMARKLYKKPKDDHYKQTQLYLLIFDKQKGFVIYENKNNSEIKVFEIDRDDEFLNKLLIRYGKIYQAYKDGLLPKRPYKSIKSAQCKQCGLREKCWIEDKDIEGDIKI